jgi:NDP-4-keto-2,6-dideoxyhexose 3-C-methyltransferase
MTEYKNSVVSGAELEPLFSFGKIYVSDFLKEGEEPKGPPCELKFGFDPETTALQLMHQPDLSLMWGSMYFYRSGTNPSMRLALKDLAERTISCIPDTGKKEIFVDVAGNDGTLTSYLNFQEFLRVNIDPSDYPECLNNCDTFIQDYFSKEAYFKVFGERKCRYVTAAAVLYDLAKPQQFLQDIYEILEDDGVAVIQLSYTPLMIEQMEFSNAVHEHLVYYNLHSLKYLTEQCGFVIRDVELNSVNGGSIRLYLQKEKSPDNFMTLAHSYVKEVKVESLLAWEKDYGYCYPQTYIDFYDKVMRLKERTVEFIKEEKSNGKSIWGYGASTKGNSLLQIFNLDNTLIDGIAEKQEFKWGRRTVGTDIPIYSEEKMRKIAPNWLLVLPWFFKEVFVEREKVYLEKGGNMIFPAPYFHTYR